MPDMSLALVVGAVIGLTQWLKTKLKIVDRAAELLSFGVGFAGGGAYQVIMFPPSNPQDWFGAAIVAILIGLVPSGIYQFGGAMASKVGTGQG